MEFIGKLACIVKDMASGDYQITFKTASLPSNISKPDDILTIKAVKQRKKRSLDANAYAWLLMSKMADAVGASKEEVYEEMILKYGQPYVKDRQAQIVTMLAEIDAKQFGLYVKCIGTGHVDGKDFRHYLVFRGSSTYDTKEMSLFIDGVVSEAKALGIDTVPKADIDRMKEKWHL